MCINADTKIELPQQLKACFSSSTAQKLVRRRKVRELGTACVALHARPPLRQSWLGLALTSGLLHHSHCHTAPAWDVGIQGHHPQETRQKPSPTPFLTEGTLSTESTSYPGCFQFVRLGFCTQDCSTWEITAGETWSAEKHHSNQTNKVPGARRKEINPRLDSWHRNGGSSVPQPVCGLATQTPNHSAYFCCVQVQWVCISGQHTPHNDPSIKLNLLRRANKPFLQTHYRAGLRVMASS